MDNRLLYRVIIKVLSSLALLVLAIVFINSLFVASEKQKNTLSTTNIAELDTSNMISGDIRKTYWNGKEIAVLLLKNTEFFVFINIGDSRNCPLFKEKDGFKDVCTGTRFDFKGREKGNQKHGFKLKIPPYYFANDKLIIGVKSGK